MVKKKSKNSDNLKAYIFKLDPNSMEGKWLDKQANRTLSLKILIKKALRQYGMVDVNGLAINDFVENSKTDYASINGSNPSAKIERTSNSSSSNSNNQSYVEENTRNTTQNPSISEKSKDSTDTNSKDSKIKSDEVKSDKESQNYADQLKNMFPPDLTEGIN